LAAGKDVNGEPKDQQRKTSPTQSRKPTLQLRTSLSLVSYLRVIPDIQGIQADSRIKARCKSCSGIDHGDFSGLGIGLTVPEAFEGFSSYSTRKTKKDGSHFFTLVVYSNRRYGDSESTAYTVSNRCMNCQWTSREVVRPLLNHHGTRKE
jgi:hypothetical protein